jgi:hypothetical protein
MKTALANLANTLDPIENLDLIKGGGGEDDFGQPNRPMRLTPNQIRDRIANSGSVCKNPLLNRLLNR